MNFTPFDADQFTRGCFFCFFRLGCLSVLYVSFYLFYCIALIDLTPLKLIIFVQYFLLVLQCPLTSKLLLVLCNFIFRIYPFFDAFVVTLMRIMRIINSIGGAYLHVSLCCFVCSYLRQKYFLFG